MFLIVLLGSCNQNQENIKFNPDNFKLTDLVTACDYIDVLEEIEKVRMLIIKDSTLSKEEKLGMFEFTMKRNDIKKAMKKKYTPEELKECPNYKREFWKSP